MGLIVAIGIVAVVISEHRPGLMRPTTLLPPLMDADEDAPERDGDLAL
jgi:hypothetical protein